MDLDFWLLDKEKQQIFLLAATFWTLLFAQVCCFIHPNLKPEAKIWDIRNRIVSFAHGLFVICYSTYRLTWEMEYGETNYKYENTMINISMGYFFYDTFAMILLNTHDTFILVHHSIVVSGIYVCLLTNIAATDIMAGFFISEVSNPFMHIKEILKAYDLTSTRFFLWNEISFYVIYLIFRIPVGIPLVYDVCVSENSPVYMKF